jgi:hypothetical protein
VKSVSEEDSFLERWARRKRAAANDASLPGAKRAPDDPRPAGDAADGGEYQTKQPDPRPAGEGEAPPDFDLAKLPSLDSITAETDIRAFLRPGVPAELSRAALRRAWSADPAIREFIGLAEYDWDFNSGEAIAGFGPLEMTEELRRRVTDMVGRNLPSHQPDRSEASGTNDETTVDAGEKLGDFNVAPGATPASNRPGNKWGEDEAARPESSSRNCEEVGSASSQYTAPQHLPKDAATKHSEVVPRRHGRALPT